MRRPITRLLSGLFLFCLPAALFSFCLPAGLSFSQNPASRPGRKYTSIERMNMDRLRAVHEDRLRFASQRKQPAVSTGYTDYKAILHAHAEDASHTGGTRPELLAAAQKTVVQIVMLTDHVRPERDFIDDSWRGMHDGVLFIPGAEHEGFLSYPMRSIRAEKWSSQADYIKLVRSGGGLIFLSHVEDHLDWPTAELDGLEIYNHHTDIKDEGAFTLWLQGSLTDAVRLPLLVKALEQYPEEVFGAQQDYLTEIIAKWDRENQQRPLTAVAANDCH